MIRFLTFEEILTGLSEDDWRKSVYMRTNGPPWSGSICCVIDTDEFEPGDDGDTPRALEGLSVRPFLNVQDLLSVRDNLRSQKPDFDMADLVGASVHYHVQDAFIVLGRERL